MKRAMDTDDGERAPRASAFSCPAGWAGRKWPGSEKRHGRAASRCRRCGRKIEYGFTEAKTAQGHIGIKVWINNGDYLDPEEDSDAANAQAGKVPKKPARQGKR